MPNMILYNRYGMGVPNLENIEKVYKIEQHEQFMQPSYSWMFEHVNVYINILVLCKTAHKILI